MILYLVRHGQSANNLLAQELQQQAGPFPYETYMRQRVAEPPLTEMGEKQARLLGTYAGTLSIGRLFCSPMLRTMQTMRPVAKALGVAPSVWIDLHEHGGVFQLAGVDAEPVGFPGLSRADMGEQFPDFQLDTVGEEGWWHGVKEDHASCHARAMRVAASLQKMARDSAEDDVVAAVSHGIFLDSLLKAIVGRLPGSDFTFNHHNTGITRVDFLHSQNSTGLVATFRFTNRVDHLPNDQVTY